MCVPVSVFTVSVNIIAIDVPVGNYFCMLLAQERCLHSWWPTLTEQGRATVTQTKHWNCVKDPSGKAPQKWGRACVGFPKRADVILNWAAVTDCVGMETVLIWTVETFWAQLLMTFFEHIYW